MGNIMSNFKKDPFVSNIDQHKTTSDIQWYNCDSNRKATFDFAKDLSFLSDEGYYLFDADNVICIGCKGKYPVFRPFCGAPYVDHCLDHAQKCPLIHINIGSQAMTI